ncbi:MAG TPA: NAD-dependent malic enzyme [Verrucomicrobiae bacterium]|nr:NAD-dependent malic enzyme [Verrucomicrobiae bacterium]
MTNHDQCLKVLADRSSPGKKWRMMDNRGLAIWHQMAHDKDGSTFCHMRDQSAFKISWSPGERVMRDPSQNRDLAFTLEQRHQLGIGGMLPPSVLSIQQQEAMELEHILSKQEPLEQYIGLIALLDRNETLFYRLLVDNLERLTPIIYTPTVGLACQQFSHIYRRPRGLFLCPNDRGHIAERLRNFSQRDIRLIVVTDNERILGLGDQGAGGMAIPVGKLVLYSAGAGIHPSLCLPISLDVGTDNGELLEDPYYIGYRGRRLRGAEYDSFVEEFVQGVRHVFPRALLQWEDFKKANAFNLLGRYLRRLPSFNDDIQGTSAVTLAGILAGLRVTGQALRDQRFLLVGSGAAGVGIGRLLRTALRAEGLTDTEVRQRQVFVDSGGVVCQKRSELETHKQEVALRPEDFATIGLPDPPPAALEQVVAAFRPTVLIGTTGQAGDFTPAVLRALATGCERPLIFPLSNPTSKAECTPSEALLHTGGRALVATGSPFEPVVFNGKKHVIGQCNNVFVFPGLGLGVLISEASRVTDSMFLAAANALAEVAGAHAAQTGCLYPSLQQLRDLSRRIAFRVAQTARDEGLGRTLTDEALNLALETFCWFPDYDDSNQNELLSVTAAAGRHVRPAMSGGIS